MQQFRGISSFIKALLALTVVVFVLSPARAQDQSLNYPHKMRLPINGQLLTLLLTPNLLTEDLRVTDGQGTVKHVPVNTYTGVIEDDPNSWVSLTKSRNKLDGVISRFGKRFRIQQSYNGPIHVEPLAKNINQSVTLTNDNRSYSAARRSTQPAVEKIAKIAIVVDSQFNEEHDNRGLEYALSLINAVDGIYRAEFGLALQVEKAINIVDASNDPLRHGSVPVETMLHRFRDYRMSTPLLDQSISLVHLFTGNKPSDAPVGLAWIDTACRTDGYDVGLSTHYRHDILLVAHEIAHNLGALHDDETSCAESTDKVMWPYISARTSQEFSNCTVQTLRHRIANSCHAAATEDNSELSSNSTAKKAPTIFTDTPAAVLAIDFPSE